MLKLRDQFKIMEGFKQIRLFSQNSLFFLNRNTYMLEIVGELQQNPSNQQTYIKQEPETSLQTKKSSINFHGFTHFPNPYQILTLIIHALLLAQAIYTIICFTQKNIKIILSIVLSLCQIFTIILWVIVTKTDPTDTLQETALEEGTDIQNNKISNIQIKKVFCSLCQRFTSKSSFHCRSCKRCVNHFDHHCIWINNCIGAVNYFQFLYMLISVILESCFMTALNAYYLSLVHTHQQKINPQIVIIEIGTGLQVIFLSPIICLLLFHLFLCLKNKTTLRMIQQFRNLQKNKNHQNFPLNEISSQEKTQAIPKHEIRKQFPKIQPDRKNPLRKLPSIKVKTLQIHT